MLTFAKTGLVCLFNLNVAVVGKQKSILSKLCSLIFFSPTKSVRGFRNIQDIFDSSLKINKSYFCFNTKQILEWNHVTNTLKKSTR